MSEVPRLLTAVTEAACSRCGGVARTMHSHRASTERLRYAASTRCPRCGAAEDADGDRPPEAVRALFFAESGHWAASLVDPGPRRAKVVSCLASILGRPLAEAEAIVGRAPVKIANGTSVEMLILVDPLVVLGAQILVARLAAVV